jgi:hypothetical protein
MQRPLWENDRPLASRKGTVLRLGHVPCGTPLQAAITRWFRVLVSPDDLGCGRGSRTVQVTLFVPLICCGARS